VSWIYLTVSKTIRDMVFHRRATAFSAWNAVRGLFLNNASQRAVYALQDFHTLQQGDLSVHDYCYKLKRLADTLTDVGHPITDQDLVVNALRGLSDKFTNALGVINAMNPLPSFLWVHSYLVQDETRLDRSHKMPAANTLLAAGTAAGVPTGAPSGASAAALVASGTPVGRLGRRSRRRDSHLPKVGIAQRKGNKPTASRATTPGHPRDSRRRRNSGVRPTNGLACSRPGKCSRPTGVAQPPAPSHHAHLHHLRP
jgi:hypothetical protein